MKKFLKFLIAPALLLAAAAVAPSAASAHTSNTWLWSAARAERALEMYQPGVSYGHNGAECWGTGYSERSGGSRLYEHFNCDIYGQRGFYMGSGVLHVRGQSMSRYSFDRD